LEIQVIMYIDHK